MFVSFTIHLRDYGVDELVRPKGPLFHRWLPDGQLDALVVRTGDRRKQVTIWFERNGFVDRDFIVYDQKRKEIDVDVMKRQGHLDAGQLWGECLYDCVTTRELDAIRQDQIDSAEYIAVAKLIIRFIHSTVGVFIDLLRFQYGQYWLKELPAWDSRTQSLGSYCAMTLWLRWRENDQQAWRKFVPGALSHTIPIPRLPGRGFEEYLTEADWRRIQNTFSHEEAAPLALRLAGRAHQLRDSNHEREAFVEAVTSLELAVRYFIDKRTNFLEREAASHVKHLTAIPLKAQVSFLAAATGKPSADVLEHALKGIEIRNEIVHEGVQPTDPGRRGFLALLECTKTFLGLDEMKTPVLFPGNQLAPPEHDGRQGVTGSPSGRG